MSSLGLSAEELDAPPSEQPARQLPRAYKIFLLVFLAIAVPVWSYAIYAAD